MKNNLRNQDQLLNPCEEARSICKCFDALTDDQRSLIEQNRLTVEFKKGEIIAKQGAFTSYILMICNGLAKVYYEKNRETLILRMGGPGTLIGLTSLIKSSQVFQYTAAAYVDTTVQLIDIHTIRHLIETNGKFAAAIIEILGTNSIQKNERFYCLTHRQAYGKMGDLLLYLSRDIFKSNHFTLPLTRKELAELAGMSTESVIRTLKKFQDDHLITSEGKIISIINPEGLQSICELA